MRIEPNDLLNGIKTNLKSYHTMSQILSTKMIFIADQDKVVILVEIVDVISTLFGQQECIDISISRPLTYPEQILSVA